LKKTTKEKIVLAAEQIFAKQGFDGCSMNQIAKASKANKASIYYYFQDKKTLYEYILESKMEEFKLRVEEAVNREKIVEEKLFEYIFAFGENFASNDLIAPIILREWAGGGENLPLTIKEKFKEITEILDSILKEAQKEGVFKKSKTFVVHLMIVGTMNLYSATKDLRSQMEEITDLEGLNLSAGGIAREIASTIIYGLKADTI